MYKKRIYFITATAILLIGAVLFAVGFAMNGFDIWRLSSETRAEASYVITDTFSSINISSSSADVTVLPSSDGTCRIDCKETERITHDVKVVNGALTITKRDDRNWYQKIGFMPKMKVTVYLPEEEYGNLTAETNTGNISIKGSFIFENVNLECDTGNITFKNSTAKILKIEADTGNITFKNSTAKILKIEADTGDVKIIDSDADEVYIETDTGDVKGHFLTDKIFRTKSDTGKVRVPKSTVGGICYIETDTGDIIFE